MRDPSPAISWIEPVLKSDLESLDHLLFDVFDVSELGPTSNITAFKRTLNLYSIMGYGKSTRRQLDALVVNVELTLVSIIQGVALSFLAESSRTPVGDLRFDQWPYIANGLMLILMFWSRSVTHALTLLRWPLEFVHNFLYIACTLIEAITFSDLTDPLRWYALNTVFAILAWLVFVVDLRRMIRQRQSEAAGPAEEELYGIVIRDYYMNILLLMPGMTLLNLAAIVGIYFWPEVFIRGGGHVVFATIQTIAFLGYLIYVVRFFATMAPVILRTNQEEVAGMEGA